jgi:hypothetical protein
VSVGRWLHGLAVLPLTASLSATSHAGDARDLDKYTVPKECWTLFVSVGQLAQARDNGVPKAKVVEFLKSVDPGYETPAQAIDDVYELTDLDPPQFESYWLLACQARVHGVPIAPMKSVHAQIRECSAKTDARDSERCWRVIHNTLLGLPKDYVPR